MNFSLGQLFLMGFCYLLFLFVTAYITDRGWLPARLIRHPAIYILSLGAYASAWSFYGAIGLAHNYGYSFLASYFGASAAFILAPILLIPILRITRSYQLSSIADLFAFRFRSQWAGTLVTLLMLTASLPLLSIQIQAVADSLHILNTEVPTNDIAFVFCGLIATFALLFGTRHPSIRQKHEGLVVAMAVGSLIKLLALSAIGLYSLIVIFGGNAGLVSWLGENTERLENLYTPLNTDSWRTLLLAFFASALVMPHMFHLLFTENINPKALYKASWGFPLFLILMALSIPPILWAGIKLDLPGNPEYFILTLGINQNSVLLTTLAFIGGLSATSGITIVSIIALSGMALNHLFLPFHRNHGHYPLYSRLIWGRRALIVAITLGSYLFYSVIGKGNDLHHLGVVAFVAFMQFLPGILATLFWPGGSRKGFTWGLLGGMSTWLLTMLIPLLNNPELSSLSFNLGESQWYLSAIYSLAINVSIFVLASSLFKPSTAELHAANSCSLNALKRPQSHEISPQDAKSFIDLLRPPLGDDAARREVDQALNDLSLDADETRPQALRELRNQLEVNLSALLGPVEAFRILSHHSTEATNETYRAKDIHILENHLENYQTRLTGLAAELDQLRRYHRHTLQKLPIGVCSLSPDLEVLMWNSDMEQFTGIEQTSTLGKSLRELPQPWNDLLVNFANQEHPHLNNQKIIFEGRPRRFNMHKAVLDEQTATTSSPQVLLVEDQTETQLLTDKLVHSERLASIGRLAAGVAHEIGNPITGIDCLAQNLKYETDNPEVLEAADLILLQTERVTRIVQSMVNFAHSGSHTQHIEHIPLNLNDCIEQAIGLVRLDARGKQQLFENHCDPDLDVIGDTHQLLQVFINLFNNAADASSATDPIRIETAAGEDSVEVSVIDSGCGIDPELQERLFEPFFTTKEPGKGTGLGLSLVYSIVEEHYGNISVESPAYKDQNKGTKFIVTLPLVNNQPSLPENHPG